MNAAAEMLWRSPVLGLRKRTGKVEEFDLSFTIFYPFSQTPPNRPKADNNKLNDIWALASADND
jgi:hypothetical protein